jgi:hypothetical protein
MKICYVISSYKLPEQVIRLVRKLNSPNAYFFIHVDKRSEDQVFLSIKDALKSFDNVVFLIRHPSHYGSFGHVRITLKAINLALQSHPDFDYMVLLTGQDYPIKSNAYIQDFLTRNYGKSFISYYTLDDSYAGKWRERLGRLYYFDEKGSHTFPGDKLVRHILFKLRKVSKNSQDPELFFPAGLTPFFGNAYWVLHRKHIEYIARFIRQNPDYVRFFKHTRVPDEVFFHSILLNSVDCSDIENDDLFYIDWSEKKSSPTILTSEHLIALQSTEDLFARKFDITVGSAILDQIDNQPG